MNRYKTSSRKLLKFPRKFFVAASAEMPYLAVPLAQRHVVDRADLEAARARLRCCHGRHLPGRTGTERPEGCRFILA